MNDNVKKLAETKSFAHQNKSTSPPRGILVHEVQGSKLQKANVPTGPRTIFWMLVWLMWRSRGSFRGKAQIRDSSSWSGNRLG